MPKSLSAETENPQKLKALTRGAITFRSARNNEWSAVVEAGTTKEQLLQSALWSVVSDQWHAYDRVDVIAADRSYFAELLVLSAGRGFAEVLLLSFHQLPALLTSEQGLPPGFEIFYAGPDLEAQYCVKRTADGVIIVKGKSSREAALAELLDHASLR
jgi:hypothetical protein